jgi:hypothetical protein
MTIEQMVREAPSRSLDGRVNTFAPADYFLGIAKRAMTSGENVRIALPGEGEIALLPGRGEYHMNVSDMAEFCQAPAALFKTTLLADANPAQLGQAKNIKDLFWQAAFHASQGRLVEHRGSGQPVHVYDVVQIRHWPNLSRLPITPNTMRICALLARRPSSIKLVSRKLGIEAEEVYQVYSAACASGVIRVISSNLAQESLDEAESKAQLPERGILRSLFAKIAGL